MYNCHPYHFTEICIPLRNKVCRFHFLFSQIAQIPSPSSILQGGAVLDHPGVAENIAPIGGPAVLSVFFAIGGSIGVHSRVSQWGIPLTMTSLPGPPTGAIFSATPGWDISFSHYYRSCGYRTRVIKLQQKYSFKMHNLCGHI